MSTQSTEIRWRGASELANARRLDLSRGGCPEIQLFLRTSGGVWLVELKLLRIRLATAGNVDVGAKLER